MTTIVACAKLGLMVADSRCTDDTIKWPSKKIERIGDSLFGCAGEVPDIEKMVAWFKRGRAGKKPKTKDFSALELNASGVWIWDDAAPISYSPERDYHAIGTGAAAALAALLMGADPVKAVEIACQIDAGSEGPVQVVDLTPKDTQ
jgi:hypothetical protein